MLTFQPARFTQARRRRGLTKSKLAGMLDVTPRTITNYEAGRHEPHDLGAVARALDFPEAFFYRSLPPDDVRPEDATFRSLTTMTARQRDSVLAAAELGIELERTCLRSRFRLPAPAVPHLADQAGEVDPELAAVMVREEWGLGQQPIRNVVHLLEAKGVRVYTLTGEDRRVGAFCLWRYDIPFVFLNHADSSERTRFDAAHELGHLCLHRGGPPPRGGRDPAQENEANRFAAAFLMPRDAVRAAAPRYATADNLRLLKKRWGVSVMSLAYRLKTLGLLRGERHERQLFADISRRGWRSDEPDPIERETSSACRQMVEALRNRGVSLAALARDLDVRAQDLSGLLFGISTVEQPLGHQRFVPRLLPGGQP